MFDHVTIRVSDRDASRRFYETVLEAIGHPLTRSAEGFDAWSQFLISQATAEQPVTRRLHVGFLARSKGDVDAFWRTGVDAGYQSDREPGPRPEYAPDYYGAFLLDPDGNSVEAVTFERRREGESVIDHLWIRVADLEESKRFYAAIAPVFGFRISERTDRIHVRGPDRSFALVAGEPTEHVHIAFPADDDSTVSEFHRVATEAGFRDNGRPGERPRYHPGYFAAFVLDPDGNNIEAVNHHRERQKKNPPPN